MIRGCLWAATLLVVIGAAPIAAAGTTEEASKVNGYGVLDSAGEAASKVNGYGVLDSAGEAASKLNGYVVLCCGALASSKINGYAILNPNNSGAAGTSSLMLMGVGH